MTGDPRDLHGRTHSFPTRRSSDLLVAAGYSALAIDARAGGDMYGHNETVERMGGSKPYEEAIDDLDGAVRWARPIGLPVVLWGSSYSASLVILVASSYPEMVKAVLSFSQIGRAHV